MRFLITLALLTLTVPLIAAESRIGGRVVDAGGAPIPDAHVYIWMAQPLQGVSSICPSCYRECGQHADSGANGDFRIGSLDPALRVRLLVVADDYEPKSSAFVDPDREVTLTLTRRAPEDEASMIRGRVVDPKGRPVLGAEVTPSGVHLGDRRGTGYGTIPGLELLSITNANGEFALRIPATATALDVRVRAPGYAPTIDRNLLPGVRRTIDVCLGAAIRGRIVHDGKPLAGVRVKLVQQDRRSSDFLGPEEIGTDNDGRFAMPALGINETYVVSLAMDAAPLVTAEKVIITGGDLSTIDAGTLEANTGCRITGKVIGATPHVRVTLFRDNAWDQWVSETCDDGTFVFDGVPADPLTLRAGRNRRGRSVTPVEDVVDLVLPID